MIIWRDESEGVDTLCYDPMVKGAYEEMWDCMTKNGQLWSAYHCGSERP